MNYEALRNNMVARQLIPRGIRDPRVLAALGKVPRHSFVADALGDRAYDDYPLPIGEGQTISQPYMVAVMTEALHLTGTEKVLEIGTGSGYQAAILAELTGQVFTVERMDKLARRARQILDDLKYHNVAIKIGDGTLGWSEYAPYDRIIVTAGAPGLPAAYWDQLAEGGRIAIPLGDRDMQTLEIIEKKEGREVRTSLDRCMFVPLIGKDGWNNGTS
ncbi:MAG: protein-L-isoaspartate(D-aspartate) O-methyltransferase [Candidatus Edwardsbacteria bacterium]|nr:protein-L-isoaspartate(D-aspartate) O-methyltransferase [Candidatus Edwardsbacteria bacterium]